jgi:PqqD family protein of HPr-rel-A system
MTDDQRPLRQGQAWVRRGSDDTAVFNPDTGTLHMLNPSALAIWELCDGETTIGEIVQAVIEVTDASRERATTDVVATLEHLRDADLVRN